MDAKQAFDAFKTAKADGTKTNQEIVTAYNKLYEKQRLAKIAGDVAEKDAEIARLRQLLEGKQKTSGKAA
jgi:hypothetical protein